MLIEVFNYRGMFKLSEIPDDVYMLRVTVMTGDEIIEVYRMREDHSYCYKTETIDLWKDDRLRDVFDGEYLVHHSDIERWKQRKSPYEWRKRKEDFSLWVSDLQFEKGL